MERVDKTDKSFQFVFGAGCGSKTIIYVAAKKFWFGTVELIENLFFHIFCEAFRNVDSAYA